MLEVVQYLERILETIYTHTILIEKPYGKKSFQTNQIYKAESFLTSS
jgi:hypothetical protein